jgi:hypothetical protein
MRKPRRRRDAAAASASVVTAELRRELDEVLRLTPNPARGAEILAYCAACHTPQVERSSRESRDLVDLLWEARAKAALILFG